MCTQSLFPFLSFDELLRCQLNLANTFAFRTKQYGYYDSHVHQMRLMVKSYVQHHVHKAATPYINETAIALDDLTHMQTLVSKLYLRCPALFSLDVPNHITPRFRSLRKIFPRYSPLTIVLRNPNILLYTEKQLCNKIDSYSLYLYDLNPYVLVANAPHIIDKQGTHHASMHRVCVRSMYDVQNSVLLVLLTLCCTHTDSVWLLERLKLLKKLLTNFSELDVLHLIHTQPALLTQRAGRIRRLQLTYQHADLIHIRDAKDVDALAKFIMQTDEELDAKHPNFRFTTDDDAVEVEWKLTAAARKSATPVVAAAAAAESEEVILDDAAVTATQTATAVDVSSASADVSPHRGNNTRRTNYTVFVIYSILLFVICM